MFYYYGASSLAANGYWGTLCGAQLDDHAFIPARRRGGRFELYSFCAMRILAVSAGVSAAK
jgi:hypothetical protein